MALFVDRHAILAQPGAWLDTYTDYIPVRFRKQMGTKRISPAREPAELIRFERFELRPYSGELRCDTAVTILGRPTLKLLMALINARGRMVTNEDLLGDVWAGLVVEPNTLQAHVSLLRKALGASRHLLKTYKGRGYAFLTEATIETEEHYIPASSSAPSQGLERSKFIGRRLELAELTALAEGARLLSLVGPGGVGKTRLALELGQRLALERKERLCVVDLAPVTTAALVANVTAAAVGAGAAAHLDVVSVIVDALISTRCLLLFDNCEYVFAAVGALATELSQRVPHLLILATSQRSLGVATEEVYRVEPLALEPSVTDPSSLGDALALFVDRARVLDRGFELHAEQQELAAKICARLDGVPLAIEMAVARLRILGLNGLYASLDMRLQLLKRPGGESDNRYPTIRAMLDWNHGLLEGIEQVLFRRLAIFPASFTLEAALSVGMFSGGERWSYIDALSDLVDKSLVTIDAAEPPRYRLLETLRFYGLEKLDAAGERAAALEHHALYFCDLFDRMADLSETTLPEVRNGIYRHEFDNIRSAMHWALETPERANIGVSLAGSTSAAWRELSFAEGRAYTDRALAQVDESTPLPLAARLYKQAGTFWYTSNQMRGVQMYEAAAAAYRAIPDLSNLAQMLSVLGTIYSQQNRLDEAKAALQEALELVRGGQGKRLNELLAVSGLGILSSALKQPDEARRYFLTAREIAQEIGDAVQEQVALANLSHLEYCFGDLDTAIELGDAAIASIKAMAKGGAKPMLRALTTAVGSYLILKGRTVAAAAQVSDALQLAIDEGGAGITACVELTAYFALDQNACRRAAELIGFSEARIAERGWQRSDSEEAALALIHRRMRDAMDADELQTHALIGAGWSEDYAATVASSYLEMYRSGGTLKRTMAAGESVR